MFGISHATVLTTRGDGKVPGTVISIDDRQGLTIACKDGHAIRAEVSNT